MSVKHLLFLLLPSERPAAFLEASPRPTSCAWRCSVSRYLTTMRSVYARVLNGSGAVPIPTVTQA
jgi:hypothetical protein